MFLTGTGVPSGGSIPPQSINLVQYSRMHTVLSQTQCTSILCNYVKNTLGLDATSRGCCHAVLLWPPGHTAGVEVLPIKRPCFQIRWHTRSRAYSSAGHCQSMAGLYGQLFHLLHSPRLSLHVDKRGQHGSRTVRSGGALGRGAASQERSSLPTSMPSGRQGWAHGHACA